MNAVWNPEYTNDDMKKAIRNATRGAKRSKEVRHFLTLPIWEDAPKENNKRRKKKLVFDYMKDLRLLESSKSGVQAVQLIEFDAMEYSFIAPTSTVTGKRKITPARWKMGIWVLGCDIHQENKLSQVKQDLDEWRMTNGSKLGHWCCHSKMEEVWCEGCNCLNFSISNTLGKWCPIAFYGCQFRLQVLLQEVEIRIRLNGHSFPKLKMMLNIWKFLQMQVFLEKVGRLQRKAKQRGVSGSRNGIWKEEVKCAFLKIVQKQK